MIASLFLLCQEGENFMKLMSLLSGNGFVMFNKELAHEVSVNGAIIFGQLCSSYESFGSKKMLTVRDGKEYFYLTSGVLEEETALSYRQQLKAIKDLEDAGYIESVIMGSPSKKYFHITDKIVQQLLPKVAVSSNKSADLNEENEQETSVQKQSEDFLSYDKCVTLAMTKEQSEPVQKLPAYKKKNKKEQYKNINKYFVNKESVNNDEIINKLISEYRLKGLSKEVCYRVLKEVEANPDIDNFGAYFRTCLENTLYKSQLKHGQIDPYERLKDSNVQLINW
jgi:DNA-binding PadR family transcriptional regulator